MKNSVIAILIGSLLIMLGGCSAKVEYQLAKLCCGKYIGTTFSGLYITNGNEKFQFFDGLLFEGKAAHENGTLYEYEIHGDYIELWSVSRFGGGDLVRNNNSGSMGVRRTWYFLGYEPAPEFELTYNSDKSVLTGAEERRKEVCLPYKSSNDLCSKKGKANGLIMKKIS